MADKILMKNLSLFGYHGVLPQEQSEGQEFIMDVELVADLKKAGISDQLDDTVDYSEVYGMIKYITENRKFRLIEKLADVISREILSRYKEIEEITICVKKPNAPIEGKFDWFGVEVKRTRHG